MKRARTISELRPKSGMRENRLSSYQRGYNSRWVRYRVHFLRANPLCVMCEREGIVEAATVVDHIVPHKGNYELMWDPKNHQPLCKRHHDSKTAAEDGGFGRKRKQYDSN